MSKKLNTELKPSEVKDILRYVISNNINLASLGKLPVAYNIEGPAGSSKTSICKQVAKEFNHHFVRLNVAELEVSDVTGYPIVEYKLCKEIENGKDPICSWVPDKLINDFILQGYTSTNEYRMSFAKPEWIQGKEDKPIILCLDDFTRAVPMMLQACMRITDEQEYVSWKLPQGSTVLLTTNPSGGDFMVTEMDEAQKTRYLTMIMKPSVDDWAEWAESDNLDGRLINFLLKHPEIIEGSATKKEKKEDENEVKSNLRSWTKFFYAISGFSDFSTSWNMIFSLGQNSVPAEHLLLLNKFIENKLDKIITVPQMLTNDITWVKNELTNVIGKGDTKRTDLSAIISKRLLNYALINHKDYTPEMVDNYGELLESEFLKADLVLLSLQKTITLFPKFSSRKTLINKLLS